MNKEEEIFELRLYPNFPPHKFQKQFHALALQDKVKAICLVMPRQNGKSEAMMAQLTIDALKNNKAKILFVCPIESQSTRVFEDMTNALFPFIASTKKTHGNFQITFKNESIIYFKSPSESIRGMRGIFRIALDEFADITEYELNSIILPVIAANKNAKIYVSGTPKGTSNILYQYAKVYPALFPDEYKCVHCEIDDILAPNAYPNPAIDVDQIVLKEQTMSKNQFDSEYRAKFVSGHGFFTNVEKQAVIQQIEQPVHGVKYFGGIDPAIINDGCAIVLVNEFYEMVFCKVLKKTDILEIISTIQEINERFKVVFWELEQNNQGLPIYQLLIKDLVKPMFNISLFNTYYKSKGELLNNIAAKLNSCKIKLLNRKDVIEEFADFERKVLDGGKVKLSAPRGKTDDIVIATSLAFLSTELHTQKGEYNSFTI